MGLFPWQNSSRAEESATARATAAARATGEEINIWVSRTDKLTEIDKIAGIPIYRVDNIPYDETVPKSFVFKAGFAVNADGAPDCYGPDNSGVDYTANGGDDSGGSWWGGPTGSDGLPILQKIYDPVPGMYVCGTALVIPGYTDDSQYRYVDSNCIPFFVLPGKHSNGAKLGDVGLVFNYKTGDNCYAIYGDIGPENKLGEGSIRLAQTLKLNADPKKGGTDQETIVYLVFPGSAGKWMPPKDWFALANSITHSWGGIGRLMEISDVL